MEGPKGLNVVLNAVVKHYGLKFSTLGSHPHHHHHQFNHERGGRDKIYGYWLTLLQFLSLKVEWWTPALVPTVTSREAAKGVCLFCTLSLAGMTSKSHHPYQNNGLSLDPIKVSNICSSTLCCAVLCNLLPIESFIGRIIGQQPQ